MKKIYLFIFSILILTSCFNNQTQNMLINEEYTMVSFVETNDLNLLSFQYQIINNTNKNIGPFYVNIIFHHDIISDYLGVTSYSSQKTIGLEGITLMSGETYQGGENLEVVETNVDLQNLQHKIANENTIEMQLIDEATGHILVSQWIHKFQYVDETQHSR